MFSEVSQQSNMSDSDALYQPLITGKCENFLSPILPQDESLMPLKRRIYDEDDDEVDDVIAQDEESRDFVVVEEDHRDDHFEITTSLQRKSHRRFGDISNHSDAASLKKIQMERAKIATELPIIASEASEHLRPAGECRSAFQKSFSRELFKHVKVDCVDHEACERNASVTFAQRLLSIHGNSILFRAYIQQISSKESLTVEDEMNFVEITRLPGKYLYDITRTESDFGQCNILHLALYNALTGDSRNRPILIPTVLSSRPDHIFVISLFKFCRIVTPFFNAFSCPIIYYVGPFSSKTRHNCSPTVAFFILGLKFVANFLC